MSFEDIMMIQIDKADEFMIHSANSYDMKAASPYVFEKVSKEQMIEFVYNPKAGEKIYRKYLNI